MAVEYLASNEFTANGTQTDWTVSFKGNRPDAAGGTTPYIASTDVLAQEITPATSTTAEVVVQKTCVAVSANVFRVTPAPAAGHIVRIYRSTQDEYNLVDYKSRQTVTEADLDLSNRQNIFIVQETSDQATRAVQAATSSTTLAYAAITSANSAIATAAAAAALAATAQSTATNSTAAANTAQAAANAATSAAAAATAAATAATTAANTATATANAQAALVASANTKSDTAISTANAAQATANGIAATAASALAAANQAQTDAAAAVVTANGIAATAANAVATAATANTNANTAITTANSAVTTANAVDGKAQTALDTANAAATTAGNAVTTANAANTRNTDAITEGTTNLYFTQNRVRASALTSLPAATNVVIAAADTFLAAMAKLQGQITAVIAMFSGYYTKTESAVVASNPNLLINPWGTVNQRGYASGTAAGAANQYTLDRWKVLVSGQILSWSAVGQGNQMTAPAGGLTQIVETVQNQGGVHTLNWTGTATATVNGTAIAKGGQTAALTAGTIITVTFTGGTVFGPKLERGAISTPVETLPYAMELEACKRFYQSGRGNIGGYGISGVGFVYTQMFPLMRVVPTLAYAGASPANVSVYDARNVTQQSVDIYCQATNATASGYAVVINYTLTAEL